MIVRIGADGHDDRVCLHSRGLLPWQGSSAPLLGEILGARGAAVGDEYVADPRVRHQVLDPDSAHSTRPYDKNAHELLLPSR